MFGVLSTLLKYIFITIIYLFMYSIIRLIYLDIRSVNAQSREIGRNIPYLKLVNRRESLEFKVLETYPLEEDTSFGRNRSNSICIKDPYLSGKHAVIKEKNGVHYITDLGSTNGTLLNGQRLEQPETALRDGDRIHAGSLDFLYVSKVNEVK